MNDYSKRPNICRGCWVSTPNPNANINVYSLEPNWNRKQ